MGILLWFNIDFNIFDPSDKFCCEKEDLTSFIAPMANLLINSLSSYCLKIYLFFFFFFFLVSKNPLSSPTPILSILGPSNWVYWSFYIFMLCFVLFCFVFLPQVWHMEVPRLGAESELQPTAYATATAMSDQSTVCDLCHSSRQCQIHR